jgi:hypothetical protein
MKLVWLLSIHALALALAHTQIALALPTAKGKIIERERAFVESAIDPLEKRRAQERVRKALGEESPNEKKAREVSERLAEDMRRAAEADEKRALLKQKVLEGPTHDQALIKPFKFKPFEALKPIEPAPIRALRTQLGAVTARLLKREEAILVLRSEAPYDVVSTFRGHRVWEVITNQDVEFFRVHTDTKDPASPWFLCCEERGSEGRLIDAAGRALPPWNKQLILTSVSIPKGTTLYVGFSSDQVYTPTGEQPRRTAGGGVQIFMKRVAQSSSDVAPHSDFTRREYRRRTAGEPVPEQKASDGKPRGPIRVKLDLTSTPVTADDPMLKEGEPVDTPDSTPPLPGENFWFDQISLFERAARPPNTTANFRGRRDTGAPRGRVTRGVRAGARTAPPHSKTSSIGSG